MTITTSPVGAHVGAMAAVAVYCDMRGRPDVADMVWSDLSSMTLPVSPSDFLRQIDASFSRIAGPSTTTTGPSTYGALF